MASWSTSKNYQEFSFFSSILIQIQSISILLLLRRLSLPKGNNLPPFSFINQLFFNPGFHQAFIHLQNLINVTENKVNILIHFSISNNVLEFLTLRRSFESCPALWTQMPVLDGDGGGDWLVKLSRGHWQGGSTQGIAGFPLIGPLPPPPWSEWLIDKNVDT